MTDLQERYSQAKAETERHCFGCKDSAHAIVVEFDRPVIREGTVMLHLNTLIHRLTELKGAMKVRDLLEELGAQNKSGVKTSELQARFKQVEAEIVLLEAKKADVPHSFSVDDANALIKLRNEKWQIYKDLGKELGMVNSSEPGKLYTIRQDPATGELFCECEGWKFRQKCRHVTEWKKLQVPV